jgi:hypothetical protein
MIDWAKSSAWVPTAVFDLESSGYAGPMAGRKSNRTILRWKKSGPRARGGCLVVPHNDARGPYRIDHYLTLGELPFFALALNLGGRRAEQISRHATVDEVKASCEQHRRERPGA